MILTIDDNVKRRDKLGIIAEMLDIAKNGALKTQIMYRANLSFTQINDYLKLLINTGLLLELNENRKDVYTATSKGVQFIQQYNSLTELVRIEPPARNGAKMHPRQI